MTDTVRQAILRYAPNKRIAEALMLGALLEGGTLGNASHIQPGDQGHSHGPFQINLLYHHDITAAQAENPDTAVQYMLRAYESAARTVNPRLWKTNPQLASEQTAYRAERPQYDYLSPLSEGPANVAAKWRQVSGKNAPLLHAPMSLDAFTTSNGGALGTWLGANTVLVIVIVVALLLLKRK